MSDPPVLLWFRRDLRLDDHPALIAAVGSGRPVVPVFIHDETVEALGAAAKWRLGLAVAEFSAALAARRSRLILRRGRALPVLAALLAETGAGAVFWTRVYEPGHIARDTGVKAALRGAGVEVLSFPGALLFEPREVRTGAGAPYSVFTPFWRAVRSRDPGQALAAPKRFPVPDVWPRSEAIADWGMGRGMDRGAAVVARHARVGEDRAAERFAGFLDLRLGGYAARRDFPGLDAGSNLSENLAWGEISPRRIWQSVRGRAGAVPGSEAAAEKFLSELGWREFAWHLMAAHPEMATADWRAGWERFPWRGDNDDAEAWRRGMTGEPFVDAAMRELYVTGRIHNRARMVAASYLTKHLLTDWRIGRAWFEQCLIDWDPAANAMGWQWVAGSGPDATPYFRIFNPEKQATGFDPDGSYRQRFLAGGQAGPDSAALAFFAAVPQSWGLSAGQAYPPRRIALAEGRARALAAWAEFQNRR